MRSTLEQFSDASAELLAERALLTRVDTKLLLPADDLQPFLRTLTSDYALLRSNGARIATYQTTYFDTPEQAFFRMHQRGRRPRYKVRVRNYVERALNFAEVKEKKPSGRTEKARLEREVYSAGLCAPERSFVDANCPVRGDSLTPGVRTDFRRVTLLAKASRERLTIDTDLEFAFDDRSAALPGLAIVEIKQPRFNARSPAFLRLRSRGVRPGSFSKYCAGVGLLCDSPAALRVRRVVSRLQR